MMHWPDKRLLYRDGDSHGTLVADVALVDGAVAGLIILIGVPDLFSWISGIPAQCGFKTLGRIFFRFRGNGV